ncbi:CocE/NonD family hydrolase [Nocardioides rubriscoriae]|uniref:CocE/NonD family hydrolase n=1 Tax=Nocardioides rubriscoriae TaxID=642762 RepID=UPI0011E02FBB|nr:CocE/NonD family hydrolase [Nocardioides rubriscoriae]
METSRIGRAVVLATVVAALVPAAVRAEAATTDVRTAPTTTAVPVAARATTTPPDHDVVRARPGTHSWRTNDQMVPVVVGPDDNFRFSIDTRLYVPDNATRRTPQPTILMTHGFGLTKDSNEVVTTARFFAAHGYNVLTYTSSGFGRSGGCVSLQSADYDVEAASQVISTVLGPRRDVLRDRRGLVIGTIGGSYGGGIQLPLAAADHRIRAAIPGRTWNNLRYSLDPNNLVDRGDRTGLRHPPHQGVFKQQWTSLFYALGNAQQAMGNGGCAAAKAGSGDPAEIASIASCPGYYADLCTLYDELTATGSFRAAAIRQVARASASTFLSEIDVPVLLVQGQSDTLFNLNDAAATFTTLRRRGVPVAMIWNSGGHGGYSSQPGECEQYDGVARSVAQMNRCYLPLRALGWMDHWLRGTPAGRGPTFTYYRDWVRHTGGGADDEQYGASARFAPRRTTAFLLSSDGRLVTRESRVRPGALTMLNPAGGQPAAYTETSNFSGPDSSPDLAMPPRDVPGQLAAFTSRPFARPYVSVGIPSATLRLRGANGLDTVFYAKVLDVAPDGSATLIHRLITPVRVPKGYGDRAVRVRLLGFAHRFQAGHRVRLVLCTTDQTSYNAKVADTVTVRAGSTFRLPGLPG